MKHYIYKVLLILGGLAVLSSCKKALEENNPSGITAESVYTTPAGFETLVSAAYSYQRWWYGKEEGYSISEMGTDLWASGAGDVTTDLTNYINLQGTNGSLTTEWQQFYAAINLCNAGINRIGGAGLAANVRPVREAELKFLRAFYYWHIVETWGGVHFTLNETQGVITTAIKRRQRLLTNRSLMTFYLRWPTYQLQLLITGGQPSRLHRPFWPECTSRKRKMPKQGIWRWR